MVVVLGVVKCDSYGSASVKTVHDVRLTWDRPDVGTQHPQEINLLLTLRIRHVDDTFVSLAPTDMCESNTGISSSSLDHGSSRSNLPFLLGFLDEVKCSSVLDGSTRRHEFGFREDVGSSLFGQLVEFDLYRSAIINFLV